RNCFSARRRIMASVKRYWRYGGLVDALRLTLPGPAMPAFSVGWISKAHPSRCRAKSRAATKLIAAPYVQEIPSAFIRAASWRSVGVGRADEIRTISAMFAGNWATMVSSHKYIPYQAQGHARATASQEI